MASLDRTRLGSNLGSVRTLSGAVGGGARDGGGRNGRRQRASKEAPAGAKFPVAAAQCGLRSAGNCFEGFRGSVELEGGGRSELRRRNPRRRPWERRRRGGKRSSHHGTCVFIGGSAEAVRQRPWGGVGQRGRPTGQPACARPVVIVCLDAAYGTWCVRNPHDTCAV